MNLSATKKEIKDLLRSAYEGRMHHLKKSVADAEKALSLSQAINDKALMAESASKLSLFYMIMGENDDALQIAQEAHQLYHDMADERGMADAMYSMAGIYYKTDNFNLGLIYLLECQTIYAKYQDYYNLSRVQKSMGTIYEYFGDQVNAVVSYESCIESGKKADDLNLISNAYSPLSGIYLDQGKTDMARELIEQAIVMKKEGNDIRGLAFALYGRAKVFVKLEKYELAAADFQEALKIHEEQGERLGKAMVLRKLSDLYLKSRDLKLAREYAEKALTISSDYKIALIKFHTYHLLYEITKIEGDTEKALQYLEQYIAEKEAVINAKNSKVIESYKAITKIESLEKEAKLQKEKAEIISQKNQELDAFFYRVSHDLKGPITSLMGMDFVAREEIKDKTSIKFLDVINSQVRRINVILDELIKLTQLSNENESKVLIDWNTLIDGCINAFQYLDNFSHVKFEKRLASDITFHAKWALVNTIMQNLIENSIKYADISKAEATTCISVEQDSSSVKITVKDNGIGMSEETANKIFDMFYQANSSAEGNGLGLYIMKRALEALQGDLEVNSEPGSGTSFLITIPKKQS